MAIAFGIKSGGKILNPSSISVNKPNQTFSSHPFLPMSNPTLKIQEKRLSASVPSSISSVISPLSGEDLLGDSYREEDSGFSEKIDSWMQDSVAHIVKNLKQAPSLVHVYYENGGVNKNGSVKLKTGKALLEEWPVVKSEWESGDSKTPDGLIFVEELKQDEDSEIVDGNCEEGVARAWGVIVQGKGVECGPACYLLKTNSVCAGMGFGVCTHFCLVRVKSFSDSAVQQFKDSWLLQ